MCFPRWVDPLRTRALQSDLKVAYSNACRSW